MFVFLRKIWTLVHKNDRRIFPFAVFLSFIISILETFSLALIFPFLNLLISPDQDNYQFPLNILNDYVQLDQKNEIIQFLGLFIICFIVFKNLVSFLIIKWTINYTIRIKLNLTVDMMKKYMGAPYSWHIKVNTSEILRNIQASYNITSGSILPLIQAIPEFLFIICTVILLLFQDFFISALCIIILSTVIFLYYKFSKQITRSSGEETLTSTRSYMQNIWESMSSIREVKILKAGSHLLDIFVHYSKRTMQAQATQTLLLTSPRYIIETTVILVIGLIVIIEIIRGNESDGYSLALAFAIAGVRLMPSLNKCVAAIQSARSNLPTLDLVYHDHVALKGYECQTQDIVINQTMNNYANFKSISFNEINFRYDQDKDYVLENLSFTINKGDKVGIVGPSGAGKSTLIDVFAGLLEPTDGKILIEDSKSRILNRKDEPDYFTGIIGYVPQTIFLLDSDVKTNVAFGIDEDKIDIKRVEKVIHYVQLSDTVKGLPQGLNTQIGEGGIRLSGGQRQRIGIARALYHNPAILIFDEATSSLDNETEADIHKILDEISTEKTLIIIAHRLNTVKNCNKLIMMNNGKIEAIGNFEDLKKKSEKFAKILSLAKLN